MGEFGSERSQGVQGTWQQQEAFSEGIGTMTFEISEDFWAGVFFGAVFGVLWFILVLLVLDKLNRGSRR